MPIPTAGFVWYELMTSDAPAAVDFYRQVVGWEARRSDVGSADYTLLCVGDAEIAGVMATPAALAAQGCPPAWSAYVGVEDVEDMSKRLQEAGGRVLEPGRDIPGVGRFAVVADPPGETFMLFQPLSARKPADRPAHGARGTVGWNELLSKDSEAAYTFYAKLFGWTKGDAIDMGPAGKYQLFLVDGVPCGGVMTRTDDQPAPGWRHYFVVDEIEAAARRVRAHGGRVANGPQQVPGGSWILNGVDPQGAGFSLTAPGAA